MFSGLEVILGAEKSKRHAPRWISFKCEAVQASAGSTPSAEYVAQGGCQSDLGLLHFRDPAYFVASQVHESYEHWDATLPKTGEG